MIEALTAFRRGAFSYLAPYFADMEGIGERYARAAVTGERYKLPKDTTYKEWKARQDAEHGAGTVDKMRKIGYNESSDTKQFEAYKARLGDEAPKSFADFQKLKYDNPTAYNDLCGLYSYKSRVPEATKADYAVYKAVRSTGIYGTVRVPPAQIDTSVLTLDTDHITERGHNVNSKQQRQWRRLKMQDKFICPLTGKEITYNECFDISMVVEGLAPDFTIDEKVKPQNLDKCKGDCMACENHPK